MHKKTLKRSTFNASTHKVKAPDHLSRLQDYEDNYNESSSHFQLPSLQKRNSRKDVDNDTASWDQNSTATSVSWSPEMEDVATWKLIQQWETVESTLYDDGEQVSQKAVLEECIHWRTQIPHLRILGKNPFLSVKDRFQDGSVNYSQVKSDSESHNEDIGLRHSLSAKDGRGLSKHKLQRTPIDDVIDIVFEHVITELFARNENETDSLHSDLSEVLRIGPAPLYNSKSSAKSSKVNWLEDAISFENKASNNNDRLTQSHFAPIKKEISERDTQANQKTHPNLTCNSKVRSSKGGRDNTLSAESRIYRPQTGRNKLGTVFKEKIVVSPVPYVLSTKQSFSTLRTTPIKFMGQSLEMSTFKGSSRNLSCFKHSAKSSTSVRISNCHSAWHAPVSPAVWPKNIKLAPIDTSRLPSSKNRSLAPSPAVLQRNRKSLSPISRSTLPASAQTIRNRSNEVLEIQGKHIVPGHSPKLSLLSAGWDYSPRITKTRKGSRSKEET